MPWAFDIRSALLVGALLTLLIGLVLWAVSRAFPPAYRPSMRWWVAGTVLQPISFVMLSLQGMSGPWVTVVAANTLLALALASYATALYDFLQAPPRPWLLATLVALAIATSVWFGVVSPDLQTRLIWISLVLTLLLGYIAAAVYRPGGPRGSIAHVTGAVFAFAAAIMLYRAIVLVLDPVLVTSVFELTHVQVLTYAVGSVLPVISTIGFLLMCAERSQHELERAARIDFLTGCYNRRAIEDLGQRAIASARRHGVALTAMVVDVDHFKAINDEFGHAAGDQALVQTVARIQRSLRAEDMLGRLGGEEFLVLMPTTDRASALSAAERIRGAFGDAPLLLDGKSRRVTVSIGLAILDPVDRHFSNLLQRADRAMYAAKHAGRDLVMTDHATSLSLPE